MKYLVLGPSSMGYYAFLGALSVVDLTQVEEIAGASAGAMLGLFLALGKTPDEIVKFSMELDMPQLTKMNLTSVFIRYGLISHGPVRSALVQLCGGDPTFKELPKKLHVAAVCLEKFETEYFSVDNAPDMHVIDAVLMSISIPLLIESFSYGSFTYVDGGIFEKAPICAFLNKNPSDVMTICIDTKLQKPLKISSFKEFILAVVSCIFKNRSDVTIFKSIVIDVQDINIFNFLLDHENLWRLFFLGRQQALTQMGLDK